MELDSRDAQKVETSASSFATDGGGKWWETSEGHRFAGEVLQLRIRREIMKFIGSDVKIREEIVKTFSLKENTAELHLSLLEKAEMIEKIDCGYKSTALGIAYLKNFAAYAPE